MHINVVMFSLSGNKGGCHIEFGTWGHQGFSDLKFRPQGGISDDAVSRKHIKIGFQGLTERTINP